MMLLTALLAALAPPECDVSYKQQQQIAASTLAALEAEGWTHSAGKLAFTSGHHYGNNPQSVYGLIYSDIAGKGLLPLFGIGPADAVLWVGCTPPPLQYFSMRSYLTGYKMANVFGSLGDAANNLRFNSSGGGTSPGNFNSTAALIVSGDLGSGARVAFGRRKIGAVLGDRCQLGCNSVTDPGTFLAPNTHAYPLSRLRAGVYGPGEILKPQQVVERAPLLQ